MQALPPEGQRIAEQYGLLMKTDLQWLDSAFLAEFADAEWPASRVLLEAYCEERFDCCARWLLPLAESTESTGINPEYARLLATVEADATAFAQTVLEPVGSAVQEEVLSKIAITLTSRRLWWLARAEDSQLRQISASRPLTSQPTATTPNPTSSTTGVFRREQDGWRVGFQGHEKLFQHFGGMELWPRLLANPGKEFLASELLDQTLVTADTSAVSVMGVGDADPTLDAKAVQAMKAETRRLRGEMDLARESGNTERQNEVDAEFLKIVDQLRKDTDDRGRPRTLGSEAEKARKAVWAAVKRSRARIGRELPELAEHLNVCVHTGRRSCYRPNIAITWQT